ncbi:glycoside hydrolase family 2 protein [Butyrivibrio sp. JL13D10]|uniref:glycoside hydrolase family 2 protein n=1 Tax=Butyrivibrio sp. JL13D10 TaxID=3236815 RepID=UPI0038B57718
MRSYIKDYPRPQLVRSNWINLNGQWDFAFDDENVGTQSGWEKGFDTELSIMVPFTYETAMSGIGREEAHEHVWYHRTLELKKDKHKRYILHLEGSDYLTKVWVNGKYAGSHKGAYERASFDITEIAENGTNDITITVEDSFSIRQPRGKQRWIKDNFGCWYVQTTGIWKTVWLEEVPEQYIKNIKLTPDLENSSIKIEAEFEGLPVSKTAKEPFIYALKGEISFGETLIRSFCTSVNSNHVTLDVKLTDYGEAEWGLHTWTPENPELYDLSLTLEKDGAETDNILSYFGMRSIRTENGQFLLNGVPIYQRLILDQGYWKDSHLTPPGEDALIDDIDKIHQLGFNGLRKHMKTEDERFLYWCDVKGMLVWSEMAACYDYDDEAVSNFTDEWKAIVRQNYNHPCIITWTPFNESWGIHEVSTDRMQQHFTEGIYHLTKSIDGMRPVIVNDGWEHTVSDILTLHEYEEKGEIFTERYTEKKDEILAGTYAHNKANMAFAKGYSYSGQPIIISEYGGIAFSTNAENEWGYGNTVSDEDAFIDRYRKITEAIMNLSYAAGFCYTQVSDVQQEVNGLMTIDRRFKVDPEKIREINVQNNALHR